MQPLAIVLTLLAALVLMLCGTSIYAWSVERYGWMIAFGLLAVFPWLQIRELTSAKE